MAWTEKLQHPEKLIKSFLKWGLLGVLMGILGQAIGNLCGLAMGAILQLFV
jgi:hypothetical protein